MEVSKPTIIFFGTDDYSKIVLEALKKDPRFEIVKIVNDKDSLNQVLSLPKRPMVGVLASFGRIIPKEILNFPQKGILNIHPSLLPKYRGSSPVQTAILNGDKETGVTIIKLDEEVDHGPILAKIKEEIKENETTQSVYQRLFSLGSEKLLKILPDYLIGKADLQEQDHTKATFTKKLTRDSGKVDWQKSDLENESFIRAMFPWPGAWTQTNINKRLKILSAHIEKGKLVLDKVQLEGKNTVTFKQFEEGYPEAKFI